MQTCRPDGETEQAVVKIQMWPLKAMLKNVIAIANQPPSTAIPSTMTPRDTRPTRSTYEV